MKNLLIQYSTEASKSMEPFKWQSAGMGYALRSGRGRWILIDGGFPADADPLISLLEAHSEGKPEIDLWIVTHPHIDHFGVAVETAKRDELRDRIKVNRFCYCMPGEDFVDAGRGIAYRDMICEVKDAARRFGLPVPHAKRGEIYETDDLRTEILLTVDGLLSPAADPNETSMIFRITVSGQTLLFLGDTYTKPARQLAEEMGAELKCDFCQLAHHALNGGAVELYEFADPRIALIPMTRPAREDMLFGTHKDRDSTRHNRYVMQRMPIEAQWISADGTRVVELPYNFSGIPAEV